MNLEYTHSVQDPIDEPQRSGKILSKPRIQWLKSNQKVIWTNLDQELSFTITTNLKGPIRQQIGLVWFGFRIFFFFCKNYTGCLIGGIWPGNGKEKKENSDQIDENKKKSMRHQGL